MKNIVELDVDFIGGGQPPTEKVFIAISAYIKAQKAKRKMKTDKRVRIIKELLNSLREPFSKLFGIFNPGCLSPGF